MGGVSVYFFIFTDFLPSIQIFAVIYLDLVLDHGGRSGLVSQLESFFSNPCLYYFLWLAYFFKSLLILFLGLAHFFKSLLIIFGVDKFFPNPFSYYFGG